MFKKKLKTALEPKGNPGVDWEEKESLRYCWRGQATQSHVGLAGSSNGFPVEPSESRYLALSLTLHHLLPLAHPVHFPLVSFPSSYPSPLLFPFCCLRCPSPTSPKEYIPSLTKKICWNPEEAQS